MTVEILFLITLCSVTVLGYMIAINAHGAVRLSISYLLATLLLAVSVYSIVERVNASADREKLNALKQVEKLEIEKQKTEELLRSKDETLQETKERTAFAAGLNGIITSASAVANRVKNIELRGGSDDLDPLLAQANAMRNKAVELKANFDKLNFRPNFYPDAVPLVREALEQTVEACRYYATYYHAEDAVQERERERLMRVKAQAASDNFEKANELISRR
jgi:hypothetical protein